MVVRKMTQRGIIRMGATWIAGFLSFGLLGLGLYSALVTDARFNPVLSTLYYILPIASFPVFLFGLRWRKAAILQAILVIAYLVVCALLTWRQCSSLGSCTSAVTVIVVNIESKLMLAFVGTAIAGLLAMAMGDRR